MNIMWFCIPAFGHTNPTIEVVRELVKRGHNVRYYSFNVFKDKIEEAGAEYISCDQYLLKLDKKSEKALRKVSTTEMSIQGCATTELMNDMLALEVKAFKPDIIVSDSVCFWGKLTAQKYSIPLICSTTTFAFNQYSSKYMHYSIYELVGIILGTGKVNRALKRLEPLGYKVKSALDIVQNKVNQDTIVYATEKFQPCSETFDKGHYCFMGPSVKQVPITRNKNKRPYIYISLGTVINDRPDFYKHCIEAFKNEEVDVLISCGRTFNPEILGKLPDNIKVQQYVDQMTVLGACNLFVTHCGMNSASEGLYMGVPLVLFPLTGEQQAVAKRISELGGGIMINKKQASSPKEINKLVMNGLKDETLLKKAEEMRADFLNSPGPKGAADFIEALFIHSTNS